MVRVVRPGGLVAAYVWDLLEGGFPFDPIWQETRAAGITGGVRPPLDAMAVEEREKLKTRVRGRLTTDAMGRVRARARANAIKAFLPT